MTETFSMQRSKWTCPNCGRVLKAAGGHPSRCGRGPELFWAKVDKGPHPKGCWIYTGFKKWDGYGWLARWMNGRIKHMTAHRYAWILTHGNPPAGMSIRHKCDVAACCNPDHLELGTHAENMADMHARERASYGERNWRAKMTFEMVSEARRLRGLGMTYRAIHEQLHVPTTLATLINAVTGKKWKVPHTATPSEVRREPRPRRHVD